MNQKSISVPVVQNLPAPSTSSGMSARSLPGAPKICSPPTSDHRKTQRGSPMSRTPAITEPSAVMKQPYLLTFIIPFLFDTNVCAPESRQQN